MNMQSVPFCQQKVLNGLFFFGNQFQSWAFKVAQRTMVAHLRAACKVHQNVLIVFIEIQKTGEKMWRHHFPHHKPLWEFLDAQWQLTVASVQSG